MILTHIALRALPDLCLGAFFFAPVYRQIPNRRQAYCVGQLAITRARQDRVVTSPGPSRITRRTGALG